MQARQLPLLVAVDPGEVLQVLDDLRHPADAFLGLLDQYRNVLLEEVQVDALAQALQVLAQFRRGDGFFGLAIGAEHLVELLQVASQAAEVGGHETDGVVDFVGDPGGQLPEGGQFFRLHQLVFQLLAFVDLQLQRRPGLPQVFGALLHQVLQVMHLQKRAGGHFPLAGQGVGHLLDFDVVKGLLQDQQAVMTLQALQQLFPGIVGVGGAHHHL